MFVEVCLSYCGGDFDRWAFNKEVRSIEHQTPSLCPLLQLPMFSYVLFEELQKELGLERRCCHVPVGIDKRNQFFSQYRSGFDQSLSSRIHQSHF